MTNREIADILTQIGDMMDILGENRFKVLAYRRAVSADVEKRLKLRGLDPSATYEFRDADSGKKQRLAGSDLIQQGLPVELPDAPQAALITYKRVEN